MTPGEIALARSVYGPSFDTSSIRVISERAYFFQPGGVLMTPDGNIYLGNRSVPDFSVLSIPDQAVFIHELEHVIQDRAGVNVRARAIELFFKDPLHYDSQYPYDLSKINNFNDLNIEQQASLIQDYFLVTHGYSPDRNANKDTDPSAYLRLLSLLTGAEVRSASPRARSF